MKSASDFRPLVEDRNSEPISDRALIWVLILKFWILALFFKIIFHKQPTYVVAAF